MFRKIHVALFCLALFAGLSCSKTKWEEANGTVRDFTGLDGCGKLIVLDNGQVLEPVSLPSNTLLIDGRRVTINYKIVLRASICMVGPTAEIKSLRYL